MDAKALIVLAETFNEKADKIFHSKFNLEILPRNDVGSLSIENGVVTMTSVSDFRDELDAFTLSYRYLCRTTIGFLFQICTKHISRLLCPQN